MALISCPSCGSSMSDHAASCPKCGAPAPVVCSECGAQVAGNAKSCPNCGSPVVRAAQPQAPGRKDKTVAGILALCLGSLGIDLFYCGKKTAGLVVLLVWVFTSWLILPLMGLVACAIIRGIKMLTKPQEEFEKLYVNTTNNWPIV